MNKLPVKQTAPSPRYRPSRRAGARLQVEQLEVRSLLSVGVGPELPGRLPEMEPNDTLDQAQELHLEDATHRAVVVGTLGNGTAAADVDWYRFSLNTPAEVRLTTSPPADGRPIGPLLSLYNDDPQDYNDLYDPLGHRLLAQDGRLPSGNAQIERLLAAGTYYVAVSGSGN